MSNILYVIDGYLSSNDKVEVTIELIKQLREFDPQRKIMLINKFEKSWGIEEYVDYYREYVEGFLVGYPPERILKTTQYDKPYVFFETNSGIIENWMPLQGVSDHVANVYNGFIFATQEANKLGYEKVFRVEYDMLFDKDEFQIILQDINRFENEEFLIYGKRQEGKWAANHQFLIDIHFCGYSTKMVQGFEYVKNDEEFWELCNKIGYMGKWSEYVIAMVFNYNLKDDYTGTTYIDFVRKRFPKSQFDRISSSGEWTDKWKDLPKIAKLDVDNGHKADETKIAIFYLNMDYDLVEVETISNKNYYKKIVLKRNCWSYDIINRQDDMVFMSKISYTNGTHNVVTHVNNETYDKLNCRFVLK